MPKPRLASIATARSNVQVVSGTVVDAIGEQRRLTERDRDILTALAEHRVLTSEQLFRLAFDPDKPNFGRQRLARLTRRGVLARFRGFVPVGSQSWRYTVGVVGAMIHAAERGHTLPTTRRTMERVLKLAASPRLDHLLGVNELFVGLRHHARHHERCELLDWLAERSVAESVGKIVRPDGFGRWRQNDRTIGFFLEYDSGTEKLDTLIGKIEQYQELALTDIQHPTLFVIRGMKRHNNFHNRASRHLGRVIIASASTDDLNQHGPAGSAWLIAGDASPRRRLIDIPQPAARPRAA